MHKPRLWPRILGLAGLILAIYVVYMLVIAGQFRSIEPHFDGECRQVAGVVGAEDIVPVGRTALIASDDRRVFLAGGPERRGGIYTLDMGDPGASPRLVSPEDAPASFHPHGLDAFGAGQVTAVMVVNHPYPPFAGRHTVEIFDWDGREMSHRETVTGPLLTSPNDVVAVDRDRFYATNDHGSHELFDQQVEDYLRLARAGVVYYDGDELREVAGDLRYANGINLSPDGTRLYVASPTDRTIHVFQRDAESGELGVREDHFIGTGVDNIEVEADGTLWVGAHPKLLSFVLHAADPERIAPSEVLRLTPLDYGFGVEQVYVDSGRQLSASTVAVRHGQRLLIGAVFDPHFLDCTMASPSGG